ncbi:hypothetical protein RCL_jg1592.t1 [Rhizophagus clarus]|uniref:Uncharacterized protein n=1 Tax=Rhizophagus clarus TaxID=94130 RepID=A0A8H3L9V4_9GLOM|nr:hypothetical protein RCL_jg1592.t1 [Rhizophagus clarus]
MSFSILISTLQDVYSIIFLWPVKPPILYKPTFSKGVLLLQNPKYLDLKFYKYRASVKYIYIINFLMTSERRNFRA